MGRTLNEFDQNMADLTGKSILITGGTGSFGQKFVRTIISNWDVKRLVIYSRDELKQYEMAQDMRAEMSPENFAKLRFFIGDVRDGPRLRMAMHGINYVVHAAALKHVPIAEYNPMECIKTNLLGAENVIESAISQGVEKVIALSTDKACNPINLYGATKLASDKSFVAANNLVGGPTPRFSVVRYGNVVGSRGSVVPFFRKIAENGKEIPITDMRMTRFWITLQQAVIFVLSNFSLMQGGEIFVPKIPSTKITDLAHVIAPQLPTREIGIRPGEKLHEMMISEDDAYVTVDMGDRYAIEPAFSEYKRTSLKEVYGATPVVDRFSYSSDSNDWWLNNDEMTAMLKVAKV
ncbi:UDP-N-acetylglucosamine 4,6-dehydratase (inverting) [Pseudorhodobacter sp.]|uniref:UDP-N-acetylglucosamine 4,6-dehydratase (inverting) n=1 Tax=Pseudorhodobacter sp. TaxID=1934400 RepID=UPI002648E74F|nr:UDP-N-acetylglucosamine 4,6-dehydratase (inverting) [Pseudorhodobacter sp.]MDN5787599.1 UDP-N-acetylglucosamine 4,6-dehydratase (inverting) [Pseudorhodobacter sp.]